MRQLLLFLVLCFSASSIHAQQSDYTDDDGRLLSKRGQVILPEAGNFSLGFDAVPFLEYFGNIFNGTQDNTVGANFVGGTGSQQVFGKYFLSDDMAIRVRARLGQNIITNRNRVILDNQAIPDPDVQVTDEWIEYDTDVRIGGGVEFRRGSGRVIGVFGGEASFLFGTNSVDYEYGNPISEGNQTPSTSPGLGFINGSRFERIIEERSNKQLGVGVNGFAGIEYFIAPKLSLGAEFILGVDFIKDYSSKSTYEYWDVVSGSTQTRTSVAIGSNDLSLATGNYGGSINLMFYF